MTEIDDGELDKIYLRARYYSPVQGRFMTEDPVKDGLNWYAYCGGNPVNAWDPSGLWEQEDENLSVGAQAYIKYYTERWEEANKSYQNATTDKERAEAKSSMDFYHAAATDIRELDADGKVQGKILDVPTYNQLNTPPNNYTNNLCWANSSAMVASYQLGDNIDRTLYIAQTITGSMNISGYNQPWSWVSTDDPSLGLGIITGQSQKQCMLTIEQIIDTIDNGNPFGVLYRGQNSGHWIVGVGYATAQGHSPLIVSNDHWGGVQNIQTYDIFLKLPDGRIWEYTAY